MAGGFDSNRDEREKAIDALRDADWDERSSKIEILMHGPPAPAPHPVRTPMPPPPDTPSRRPTNFRGLVMVLETMPPWGRVIVVLAVIAASAFGTHRLGWW